MRKYENTDRNILPKTVSNVISAVLDHLKPKFSSPNNRGGRHRAPTPLLKISGSAPVFPCNWNGFRPFKMVKRNKFLWNKERNYYKNLNFAQKESSY